MKVAPAELENLLRSMDGVLDVAVIGKILLWENILKCRLLPGIPDERAGELPRAYVVKSNDSLAEKDVQDFVANALSKHKHLAGGVEFVKEIPKSAAGKILRKDLKASYEKNYWLSTLMSQIL